MHWMPAAFSLARVIAGRSMDARIAIIAITTSNSMSVKPLSDDGGFNIVRYPLGRNLLGLMQRGNAVDSIRSRKLFSCILRLTKCRHTPSCTHGYARDFSIDFMKSLNKYYLILPSLGIANCAI